MENVKGIIWDLDNTLYRFTDDFKHHCNIAASKAAIDCGIDLPFDECLKISTQSEMDHNYSLHEYVLSYGLEYRDLHHIFHDYIECDFVVPINNLNQAMQKINLPQAIVTNASRVWTNRVLSFIGLKENFADDVIFCMEDFHYSPKARSNAGMNLALEKLKVPAHQTVLIDDLSRNLRMAKQGGLITALTHCNDDISTDDFIDYCFETTADFLNSLRVTLFP